MRVPLFGEGGETIPASGIFFRVYCAIEGISLRVYSAHCASCIEVIHLPVKVHCTYCLGGTCYVFSPSPKVHFANYAKPNHINAGSLFPYNFKADLP